MTAEHNGLGAFDEYRRLLGDLPSGLAGSIELVARQLSDRAERLLRLGAIPHSVDVEVAAVLIPEAEATELEEAAQELRPLSFVLRTSGGSMLHDEVRAHLFGQWLEAREKDADKWGLFKAVSARLADYFGGLRERSVGEAETVTERQRIFHLIGADSERGFAEFQKLCRAERYRYRLSSCEALIKLAQEYLPVLSPEQRVWLEYHEAKLLSDMRHHEEAKLSFERLIAKSTAAGDDALKARSLFRLASVLRETREFERARTTFLELRAFAADRPEAADLELRAMQGFSSLLIKMDRTKEAREILDEVLTLAGQKADRSTLAACWNTMGILHRKLGRPRQALEAFQEALKELELGDEVYRPRQVYNNIGLLHADRAEWSEARESLEKSLDIARKAGDMNGEATALSNIVRVYLALDVLGEALAAADRAIELFLRVHNWYDAAMTSRGLARFYRREGRIEESRAAFLRARELFLRAGVTERAEECESEAERLGKAGKAWGGIKRTLVVIGCIFALGFLVVVVALLLG